MLGLGTTITSIDSGQIYKELSELSNYADLDIHFDFSTLAGDHGVEIADVANSGQTGLTNRIDSNEGSPSLDRETMSKSSIVFDGGNDILDFAANYTTTGKPFTFFIVFQKADLSNDSLIVNADDGTTDYIKTAGGSAASIQTKMDGEAAVTTVLNSTAGSTKDYSIVANTPTVLVIRRDGTGILYFYADNNLFIATKDSTAGKAAANFTIGAVGGSTASGATSSDWTGNVGELGLYDGDVGELALGDILASLCTKWGVERIK